MTRIKVFRIPNRPQLSDGHSKHFDRLRDHAPRSPFSVVRWHPRRGSVLIRFGVILLAIANIGTTLALRSEDAPPTTSDTKVVKQLRAIYAQDAAEFAIYRDSEHREKLELREEPVYLWTNVIRRQYGSVFVWTWHGRPEAIGSIFSYPAQVKGKRGIMHEFHSLSTSTLVPEREAENHWEPKTGLKRKPVPDAPKPADSARQRMFQMRELSRDFTAHSIDLEEKTWELRLLTQPLFRYESTDPNIIDGALFAYVTSAGTDPEVVLLIEAQRNSNEATWSYSVCRFSDLDLYVKYRDKEIWTSIKGEDNVKEHDAQHLYRLYRDRRIDEIVPDTNSP